MSKKRLLFITEGEIDEPEFINKFFSKCYPDTEYDYYSYRTEIHTFSRLLFKSGNEIDEYLDVKNVLKEVEENEAERNKLSKKYSDIILVFDFDPHSSKPEFSKIKKMLQFFNDSTDNGKLYINYPMMQSYKHIKNYIDEDFKDRRVSVEECSRYKELVHKESFIKNISQYNYPLIIKIICFHVKKANYLLNGEYCIPSLEQFYEIDLEKIYDLQLKNKDKDGVYVLNTFLFHLVDYNPRAIIDDLAIHEKYEPKKSRRKK